MFHYVYAITVPATGEHYIGVRSSKVPPCKDSAYMGSGHLIRRKLARHGGDKHVLLTFDTRAEADACEATLVPESALYRATSGSLNLRESGGSRGVLSEASRAKLRASKQEQGVGRTHSPETRAKIAAGRTGWQHTAETKEKIGAVNRGKRFSAEWRAKMSAAHKGKVKSLTHLANIAAAKARKKRDAQHAAGQLDLEGF